LSRASKKLVVGWKLPDESRAALLALFRPVYPDVVADHVTLQSGVHPATPLPDATSGEVIGVADDGSGVQALVVRIGNTSERPDGGTYHITWSLDAKRGRAARQSNDVIRERGWTELATPIGIRLRPDLWAS
jgi:hypothetical protein